MVISYDCSANSSSIEAWLLQVVVKISYMVEYVNSNLWVWSSSFTYAKSLILCKNDFCWGPNGEPQWFLLWVRFRLWGQTLPPIAVFGALYTQVTARRAAAAHRGGTTLVSPTGIKTGHHEKVMIHRPNSLARTAASARSLGALSTLISQLAWPIHTEKSCCRHNAKMLVAL